MYTLYIYYFSRFRTHALPNPPPLETKKKQKFSWFEVPHPLIRDDGSIDLDILKHDEKSDAGFRQCEDTVGARGVSLEIHAAYRTWYMCV